MEKHDAIIIGSGIGGLTCGALLAKNGVSTLVIEQHSRPGGYVTSYIQSGLFTADTIPGRRLTKGKYVLSVR